MSKRKSTTRTISTSVPLGPLPPDVYLARHVDVQLSHDHAVVLRRIYEGLHSQARTLANGRFVQTNVDVVRYMLEQVGEAADKRRQSKAGTDND